MSLIVTMESGGGGIPAGKKKKKAAKAEPTRARYQSSMPGAGPTRSVVQRAKVKAKR